jgi:hypothetical protein
MVYTVCGVGIAMVYVVCGEGWGLRWHILCVVWVEVSDGLQWV